MRELTKYAASDSFPRTDALRRFLIDRAHLIQRCFDRNLTVQQCAEYLAFSGDRKELFPLESLASEEGAEAIREVFWVQQQKEPAALFQKLLGPEHQQEATWVENVRFAARWRPFFLSWIPARMRSRVEAALRPRGKS